MTSEGSSWSYLQTLRFHVEFENENNFLAKLQTGQNRVLAERACLDRFEASLSVY